MPEAAKVIYNSALVKVLSKDAAAAASGREGDAW